MGGGLQSKDFTDVMAVETMELVQRSYSDTLTAKPKIGAFCRPVTMTVSSD